MFVFIRAYFRIFVLGTFYIYFFCCWLGPSVTTMNGLILGIFSSFFIRFLLFTLSPSKLILEFQHVSLFNQKLSTRRECVNKNGKSDLSHCQTSTDNCGFSVWLAHFFFSPNFFSASCLHHKKKNCVIDKHIHVWDKNEMAKNESREIDHRTYSNKFNV